MALSDANALSGDTPSLPQGPPYVCAELAPWAGIAFDMPPTDPRLLAIHRGGDAPTPPLDNLVGARQYWIEHPDWMELLDPNSPSHHDKMVERALYLDQWADFIPHGSRVLDLGGGVGRFTSHLLDLECAVEVVDPDLRSLWRCLAQAVHRPGSIDLHWSTGEAMPDLAPVDVAIAAEVLCYVENAKQVVQRIFDTLKPGGHLLCSVEARWGWAMGPDVHEGTIEAFLTDGVVHAPKDRWVRTYTESDFRELLAPFHIISLLPTHYALSGPFEAATGPLGIEAARQIEARLREHPVAGPLNRAFTAVVQKPK